jgi:hypothetical protein
LARTAIQPVSRAGPQQIAVVRVEYQAKDRLLYHTGAGLPPGCAAIHTGEKAVTPINAGI